MSDLAIRVEGLGKQYRIGGRQERYKTLRDTLTDALYAPFRAAASVLKGGCTSVGGRPSNNYIWALKDVSFDVKPGEVIGIIGRNGAGKSTLLKILSRITEPTEGYADIRGRVGSLLEVGTGFHPELTGRENIYLNGAILGMKKAEIERKFDEIAAFAEVEKFLDTPVKYYSSGMYMRLAFAVAAHLQPEILIVDEVLAVGDMAFQRKCLGKMEEVSRQGRTVLFVSHNLAAVLNLCSRGILLEAGHVLSAGKMKKVVDEYLNSGVILSGEAVFSEQTPENRGVFYFKSVRIRRPNGEVTAQVDLLEGFDLELTYQINRPLSGVKVSFRLRNSSGYVVLSSADIDQEPLVLLHNDRKPAVYHVQCHISRQFLRAGRYSIDIWAGYPGIQTLDEYFQAIAFDVVDTGSTEALIAEGSDAILTPVLPWKVVGILEA